MSEASMTSVILKTRRLILRPHKMSEAKRLQQLAGHADIAATTGIPHPYKDGMAEEWIQKQKEFLERGADMRLAVILSETGELIGGADLFAISKDHSKAELGYWIGRDFWGQGYASEASEALLEYGFEVLGLNRIYARHMSMNPASGKVMRKIGMIQEGHLRQDVRKNGVLHDLEIYGLLKPEWESLPRRK